MFKKLIPLYLKKILIKAKKKHVDSIIKRVVCRKVAINNKKQLKRIKNKDKVKVVFLVIHRSVWKVDSVFCKMLKDDFFDPIILVCPHTTNGQENMMSNMKDSYDYFKGKGYPVLSTLDDSGNWLSVKELCPDIVFFTNPYFLTNKCYYSDIFRKYLSVYVPYYFMATTHAGTYEEQLNTDMMLSMWKIFWPHETIYKESVRCSYNKGHNGVVVGYPAVESLIINNTYPLYAKADVWKSQYNNIKKKIIFAPHHSIELDDKSLSSFLILSDFMVEMANKYKDRVQWSFKPHPMLKSKLYTHPEWGRDKTECYYDFWKNSDFCQLDEGEYDDLFSSSDAIIHDCSSFIVEYAFTGKPGLYLMDKNRLSVVLNEFGKGVIDIYRLSCQKKIIENFIDKLIDNKLIEGNRRYFTKYLNKYYNYELPSERILRIIKSEFKA